MEDVLNTVEQELENDLITAENEIGSYYNSTTTSSGGHVIPKNPFGNGIPVYPDETLSPEDCASDLGADVKVFWDLVYSMFAFLILTILLPYLVCCCYAQRFYRSVSWLYFLSGTLQFISGILLVTALLPDCPSDCGEFFCDLHKYNPGPIYGCIIMGAGFLWWCKGCMVRIQGQREETLQQQADRAMKNGGGADGGTEEERYLGEFRDTTDYDPEHRASSAKSGSATTTGSSSYMDQDDDHNKLIPDIL